MHDARGAGTVDSGEAVPKEVEIGNLILDLEGDQL